MMSRVGRLMGFAAVLLLVCGVAGDAGPTKQFTRPCELSGDATGGGEIGVKTWSWGPLTMTVQSGGGLEALFVSAGLGVGSHSGPGRVGNTRLDFAFDVPASDCRPKGWDDTPGPGTGICQYHLILVNGVYDQNADMVVFSTGTQALLYDTWLPPDDWLISEGTANLVVHFTDGDGGGDATGSENGGQCKDGKDNDGDGAIDCVDSDCWGTKWCP